MPAAAALATMAEGMKQAFTPPASRLTGFHLVHLRAGRVVSKLCVIGGVIRGVVVAVRGGKGRRFRPCTPAGRAHSGFGALCDWGRDQGCDRRCVGWQRDAVSTLYTCGQGAQGVGQSSRQHPCAARIVRMLLHCTRRAGAGYIGDGRLRPCGCSALHDECPRAHLPCTCTASCTSPTSTVAASCATQPAQAIFGACTHPRIRMVINRHNAAVHMSRGCSRAHLRAAGPTAAHPVLAGEGVEAREELVEKLLRGRGVEQAAGRAVGWLAGGRRTGRWLVAGWWEGGGRVGGRCAAGTHHDLAGREVAAHRGEAADVCGGGIGWLESVGMLRTWLVRWSVGAVSIEVNLTCW
jgi:hypothetical protein